MIILLLSVAAALQVPLHHIKKPLNLKAGDSKSVEIGNYYNEVYYLTLYVGSNSSEFYVMIDTGSSYLWLPDIKCSSCENADNFYNSSASSTSSSLAKDFEFTYGQSSVYGTGVKETVKASKDSSLELTNYAFLSVSQATNFKSLDADGILGLSFAADSLDFKNFIEELEAHSKISSSSFSLYLNHNYLDEIIATDPPATIIFGSYDLNFASEDFKYVKKSKDSNLWESTLGAIKVDVIRDGAKEETKTLMINARSVVFHTGSSLIHAPSTEYNALMSLITDDYTCYKSDNEIYCFCSSLDDFPIINFEIGDYVFDLTPEFYVQNSMGICRILLLEDENTEKIILGLPFLRKYYSFFDYERKEIGLAPAIRAYKVVYSSGSYYGALVVACFASVAGFYLYKSRKPVKEALL